MVGVVEWLTTDESPPDRRWFRYARGNDSLRKDKARVGSACVQQMLALLMLTSMSGGG